MKSKASPRFWRAYAQLYSCCVMNTGYRVLGTLVGDTITWRWIGPHDEYMRLLK